MFKTFLNLFRTFDTQKIYKKPLFAFFDISNKESGLCGYNFYFNKAVYTAILVAYSWEGVVISLCTPRNSKIRDGPIDIASYRVACTRLLIVGHDKTRRYTRLHQLPLIRQGQYPLQASKH